MKTINRRTLAALVFGLLTMGAGAGFAQDPTKAHSCCAAQTCCGSECRAGQSKRGTSTTNWMTQWHKAKHGWDLPGTRPAANTASPDCCKNCC